QKNLANELVIRFVFRDRVSNPNPILPNRFGAEIVAAQLKQVSPLVGPEFNVIVTADQIIDQLRSLLLARRAVSEKSAPPLRLGRQTGQIKRNPPDEFRIAAYFRRQNLHLLQLRVDVLVDEIVFG